MTYMHFSVDLRIKKRTQPLRHSVNRVARKSHVFLRQATLSVNRKRTQKERNREDGEWVSFRFALSS